MGTQKLIIRRRGLIPSKDNTPSGFAVRLLIALTFVMFTLIIFLSGCFSPWQGEEKGSLVISVGSNSSRTALNWDPESDSNNLTHYVTLTPSSGPVQTMTVQPGVGTGVFSSIAVGPCQIHIYGRYNGQLKSQGVHSVTIKQGSNSVIITMGQPGIELTISGNTALSPVDSDITLTFNGLDGSERITLDWGAIPAEISVSHGASMSIGNGETVTLNYNGGAVTTLKLIPTLSVIEGSVVDYTLPDGFSVDIYDGLSEARAISVNQANATKFNAYASTDGLTKYYKQTEDITLTGNWTAIGNSGANNFSGTYDGNGYVIRNLTINDTAATGMFGYMYGTVRNVALVNVEITSTGNYVGGVAGFFQQGLIENSYVTGKITGGARVGGIAGHNLGNVSNCYTNVDVTGNSIVGGIVGYISDSGNPRVENCYALGAVSGESNVGGIAGSNSTEQVALPYVVYCVALNSSITRTSGTNTTFGRVVGGGDLTNIRNNYARSDMTFDGTLTGNNYDYDKDGQGISSTDFNSESWWKDAGTWNRYNYTYGYGTSIFAWDFGTTGEWAWGSNNLPRLRGVGGQ